MSDTERDAHRQELRDASTHVTVALPHTGGEFAHALSQLEEVLLALVPEDPGDDLQLPASLATHHGADAVGRLAGYVAAWEHDDPAVQPIAPDGRFELVPLLFASLGRTDRDRITAVVAALVEVEDLVTDYTGSTQAAHQLLVQGQRLVSLIHLPWNDDVDRLHDLLGRGATSRPTERVVLTPDELAACQRVTERIQATWYANDPLERVLYRGLALPNLMELAWRLPRPSPWADKPTAAEVPGCSPAPPTSTGPVHKQVSTSTKLRSGSAWGTGTTRRPQRTFVRRTPPSARGWISGERPRDSA